MKLYHIDGLPTYREMSLILSNWVQLNINHPNSYSALRLAIYSIPDIGYSSVSIRQGVGNLRNFSN